ncbi:uncharacterized protein LOC106082514 [Stomoxys calcitrans]|uniref:uncharacterized protein LOC106082514 n=1 Tax=Stomoxys calcitrans TaxID=35570 RepID=UPI0027E33042|nr:uncharacterized protein LOC106082514 [Stomoxys calcitrans]XP_059216386.1 uncharacterized protein LOC106082514 [Stomoxys calcitrans]
MGCHQCLLISAISVIIFGITDINASRFFSVELSGANVTYFDREVLKCMNLRIYNPKLASMDFTLAKDLSKFNLHFLLNIIRKDERQNNIMNVTMSGCEALAYNKNGNFLKIVLREVHRVSNLPKKCPLLKRLFTVEFSNASVTHWDAEFLQSLNCRLYSPKVIYADFQFVRDLYSFAINAKLDLIKKDNRHTSLMDISMSGCEFLNGIKNANLIKVIYREVVRVTNLPKKCPFSKDTIYTLKNFTLKDNDFPPVIPTVIWQMQIEFTTANKTIASIVIDGRVRKF